MKKLWSPELRQVYSRFPTIIRSKDWDAVVERVKAGDKQGALDIARAHEGRSRQIQAQNVMARRIRIQRMALFTLQTKMTDDARKIFSETARQISTFVLKRAAGLKTNKLIQKKLQVEMVILRRELNKWLTGGIWQSVLLGVRNMEDAMVPIFKANQESFAGEADLLEDAMSFGLTADLAGKGNPKVKRGSDNWDKMTEKIYTDIIKKGFDGQTPSSAIWNTTKYSELEMRRIISRELARGGSPRDIAKRLEQYLSPDLTLGGEQEFQRGPGVYRKPFKNAMRLARTETGRAYTNSTAAWASTRDWVEGLMVTLSPAHDGGKDGDDCDDIAGDVLSPEDFTQEVPVHPHCMCFPTVVIKSEYLKNPVEEESMRRIV